MQQVEDKTLIAKTDLSTRKSDLNPYPNYQARP